MYTKIANALFILTAVAGIIILTTLMVDVHITGPLWIAVMAAIGIVFTATIGLFAIWAVLFGAFILLCMWSDRRNGAAQ